MNTYVQKISKSDFKKVKAFFETKNASFENMQYAEFKAKLANANGVLYTSGKFVMQGKELSSLVNEFERAMGLALTNQPLQTNISVSNSETMCECEYATYIGTDESGKGDYFGSLVIAGVMIDENNREKFINLGIKDSKKLTDSVIKKYAAEIKNNSIFSITLACPHAKSLFKF